MTRALSCHIIWAMKIEQPHEQVFLYTLDNGLRVVIDERTTKYTQLSSIYGHVCVGAQDDGDTPGISHFLEHVIADIPEELSIEGSHSHGAHTGEEKTQYYYSNILPEYKEGALKELCSFLARPKFTTQTVEQERARILREFDDMISNFDWAIVRARKNALGGHPITNKWAGRQDIVEKITYDQLMTHYETKYVPENIILSLAGPFDKDQTVCTIENWFSKTKRLKPTDIVKPTFQPEAIHDKIADDSDSAVFSMSFPSSARQNPLRTRLMDEVITFQASSERSILANKLYKDQGLYYYGFDNWSTKYAGLLMVFFQCPVDRAAKASLAAAEGIEALKSKEQYNIKSIINRKRIEEELERPFSNSYAEKNASRLMWSNEIYQPLKEIEALEGIKHEEVQCYAQKLFTSNCALFVQMSDIQDLMPSDMSIHAILQ